MFQGMSYLSELQISVDAHQTPKPKCFSERVTHSKKRLSRCWREERIACALQTCSYLVLLIQRSWAAGTEEILFIKIFVLNVYRLCLPLLLVLKKHPSELFDVCPTRKVDAGKRMHSFLVSLQSQLDTGQAVDRREVAVWSDQGRVSTAQPHPSPEQMAPLLLQS